MKCPTVAEMNTIFHECRQCGSCCRTYRKILLDPSEVEFIQKMGGHVGIDLSLTALREQNLDELMEAAKKRGKIYMIHPDGNGCMFLEKRNDKYYCRIYPYRPRSCRGFRCNLADSSMIDLFAGDAMHLLGQNHFGLPLDLDE